MTKNPVVNAMGAIGYILAIVWVMNTGVKMMVGKEDSWMAPVTMISLFTLSAAVMGYVFCYQPIQFYVDGKKKQGTRLFLQTVGVFGCFTLLAMVLLFAGAFSR